jgi:hypothetical protein
MMLKAPWQGNIVVSLRAHHVEWNVRHPMTIASDFSQDSQFLDA